MGLFSDPVARRYFVMNTYDGVMTALGIIFGTFLGNVPPATVFKAGLGASIAIMISGLWGAYMAERAERLAEKKEMEKLLLKPLDGTTVEEKLRERVLLNALIDGLSPFLGSLLPLFPFLLADSGIIGITLARISSVIMALLILIFLGVFLAKISGEKPLKRALIFLTGGLLTGAIVIALEVLF